MTLEEARDVQEKILSAFRLGARAMRHEFAQMPLNPQDGVSRKALEQYWPSTWGPDEGQLEGRIEGVIAFHGSALDQLRDNPNYESVFIEMLPYIVNPVFYSVKA